MAPPFEHLHNQKKYEQIRRKLRSRATPAEAALWKLLKGSQLEDRKFRRQHSIGSYIVDFYCPAEKLAIELDGASHDDPFRHEYDSERDAYLREQGIRIVRFENKQVFQHQDLVLQTIAAHFGV